MRVEVPPEVLPPLPQLPGRLLLAEEERERSPGNEGVKALERCGAEGAGGKALR